MTSRVHVNTYVLIKGLLSQKQQRLHELRYEVKQLEIQEAAYREIEQELREGICDSCGGQGYIRMQYAQDDIKTEPCTRCQATGIRSEIGVR